jgi:hypothetical protein
MERNAVRRGKRGRMEYNLALDEQEMHTYLCAVLDDHRDNITSHDALNLFVINEVQCHEDSKE